MMLKFWAGRLVQPLFLQTMYVVSSLNKGLKTSSNPQSKFRIQKLWSYWCNYTSDINNNRNYCNRILKKTVKNILHVTQQTKTCSKSKISNILIVTTFCTTCFTRLECFLLFYSEFKGEGLSPNFAFNFEGTLMQIWKFPASYENDMLKISH